MNFLEGNIREKHVTLDKAESLTLSKNISQKEKKKTLSIKNCTSFKKYFQYSLKEILINMKI